MPVGTTGESPTLTHEEHEEVIERVVKARGRPRAGHRRHRLQQHGRGHRADRAFAKKVGADAALLVSPYYNKPTQEGMYQHFKAIAEEVDLPIVLYNIPGRCGVEMTPETIARLSKIENIVGVKEATGSSIRLSEIAARVRHRPSFHGDDSLTLPLMRLGGKGVISVLANIVPADVKAMTDLILEGDLAKARHGTRSSSRCARACCVETNPIPIKAAMAMLDMSSEELRLPMTPLEDSKKTALRKTLTDYGLLS